MDTFLITCSGCGKQYRVPEESRGKRVKCKACQATFEAVEVVALAPAAEIVPLSPLAPMHPIQPAAPNYSALFQPSAAATRSSGLESPRAAKTTTRTRPKATFEPDDTLLLPTRPRLAGTATTMIVMGVIAAILPHFGLQYKVFAAAGETSPVVGALCGLLGCALLFFAYLPKWGPAAGISAACAVLLIGGCFLSTRILMGQGGGSSGSNRASAYRGPSESRPRSSPGSRVLPPQASSKGGSAAGVAASPSLDAEQSMSRREALQAQADAEKFVQRFVEGRRPPALPESLNRSLPSGAAAGSVRSSAPSEESTTQPKRGFSRRSEAAKLNALMESQLKDLHDLMDQELGLGVRLNFPAQYLSTEVGGPAGVANYYANPKRLPMVGIMLGQASAITGDPLTEVVAVIGPVYASDDPLATVVAREGYAVAGLNVHADGQHVLGVQCLFMKLAGKRFDPNDRYEGPWLGTPPPQGSGTLIGGDGRAVFGIWCRKGSRIHAVGLIQDADE